MSSVLPTDVIKIIAKYCLDGRFRRVCCCKRVWNPEFPCECSGDKYISNAGAGDYLAIAATCWDLHRELYRPIMYLKYNYNHCAHHSNLTLMNLVNFGGYTRTLEGDYGRVIVKIFNELLRRRQLEIN